MPMDSATWKISGAWYLINRPEDNKERTDHETQNKCRTACRRRRGRCRRYSCTVSAAYSFFWGSNSLGDWANQSSYRFSQPGSVFPPQAGDYVVFDETNPATVVFGVKPTNVEFRLPSPTDVSDYWTNPLTFSGAGAYQSFLASAAKVLAGRELVLDGFTVEFDHEASGGTFFWNHGGRIVLRNRSTIDLTRTSNLISYYYLDANPDTYIDGSTFRACYVYAPVAATIGTIGLTIRNGGLFSAQRSDLSYATAGGVRVVDGDITLPTDSCTVIQALPERSGTATFTGGMKVPEAATDGDLRLGGKVQTTWVTFDRAASLYGRGAFASSATMTTGDS